MKRHRPSSAKIPDRKVKQIRISTQVDQKPVVEDQSEGTGDEAQTTKQNPISQVRATTFLDLGSDLLFIILSWFRPEEAAPLLATCHVLRRLGRIKDYWNLWIFQRRVPWMRGSWRKDLWKDGTWITGPPDIAYKRKFLWRKLCQRWLNGSIETHLCCVRLIYDVTQLGCPLPDPVTSYIQTAYATSLGCCLSRGPTIPLYRVLYREGVVTINLVLARRGQAAPHRHYLTYLTRVMTQRAQTTALAPFHRQIQVLSYTRHPHSFCFLDWSTDSEAGYIEYYPLDNSLIGVVPAYFEARARFWDQKNNYRVSLTKERLLSDWSRIKGSCYICLT